MRVLVPWPGIEPRALALGAWSFDHWTISVLIHSSNSGILIFFAFLLYFKVSCYTPTFSLIMHLSLPMFNFQLLEEGSLIWGTTGPEWHT